MKLRNKILIIEDEKSIAKFISATLEANDFDALIAETGKQGLAMLSSHCPDLVILDLGLPDMDGLEIIKKLRSWSNMPILVVSARTHEHDKVETLDLGADDYLTKPFGTDELLARIRAALRRALAGGNNTQIMQKGEYKVGDLVIQYDKHQVIIRGEMIHFTLNEFRILALLGKYAGKVLTYDFIMKELWGPRANTDNQILRVNMANIRRKIEENPAEPRYIFTEIGVGYRMADS